jgi:integrase/recombinase XerD
MTKILGRNPARRCKPVREWPAADRALRALALRAGDVIDEGGALACYSHAYIQKLDKGYGRWLQWLDMRGELDPVAAPGSRVTRQRVAAYTNDLRTVNSTMTTMGRLDELYKLCRILDPQHPLPWLPRVMAIVRAQNVPLRIKVPRMVGAEQLFQLGIRLMQQAAEATTKRLQAMQYRNGLIVSLLAACPLRRRNLGMLTIADNFIRYQQDWWIELPGDATKTGVPLRLPLPADLTGFIDAYLSRYRPVLLGMRRHWVQAPGNALWISTDGSAMSTDALYLQITRVTRTAFGRSVNPHLFRDCAATSVAVDDPAHIIPTPRSVDSLVFCQTDPDVAP